MTATATTTHASTSSTPEEDTAKVPEFDHDLVWRNVQRWRDAICERNARTGTWSKKPSSAAS